MKSKVNQFVLYLLSCFLVVPHCIGCGKMSSSHPSIEDSGKGHLSETKKVRHKVTVRLPPPVVGAVFRTETSEIIGGSKEFFLKCTACHSIRPSNNENAKSSHLDEFHQGLRFSHGQLACVSCHNPSDSYSSLRLADGRTVPFEESITLCAQCHGPQYRDYEHGAHGGMSGYWDLTRGDRVRNHCQHCHDPHVPNYPKFRPAAPPQDRFKPSHSAEGASHDR